MALPVAPNVLIDIYQPGSGIPNPDVANVPAYLQPAWRAGSEAQDRPTTNQNWTHILLVDADVDIRDSYGGAGTTTPGASQLFIVGSYTTSFFATFVERVGRGTATDHKRVFLDRNGPVQWPTNEL